MRRVATLAVATVAALAVAAGGAGAAPAAAATSPPPPPSVVTVPADPDTVPLDPIGAEDTGPRRAPAARLRAQATGLDVTCTARATSPVRDGQPIRVSLPPAPTFTVGTTSQTTWTRPASSDPTWQLWFYSLRWVSPLMRSAVEDGQKQSQEAIIRQVLAFYRQNPDRGKPTLGWDEGGSLRRLEALNCLYRMTHDARLVPGMRAEAAVLFGPRYYGPPYHPVHNHGLMANLRLVEAGTLVGRADWVTRARARLRSEAGQAFSRSGTSYEQSSAYQFVNRDLWRSTADLLADLDPADPTARTIRATVARATNVGQWLTEPDGRIVQIGNARRVPGEPAPKRRDAGVFRDDQAGLLVARSAWSPAASMFTLRYGPKRWAHGNHDKGSVTWTVGGTRVLTGTGYFGYEAKNPYVAYQKTPEANNVPAADGRRFDTAASARLAGAQTKGGSRIYTVTDKVYGVNHSRRVTLNMSARAMTVADAYTTPGTTSQHWHLDPEWQAVSARTGAQTARFRHRDGRILEVRTTGRLAGATRGATRPVAGWTFPSTSQPVPNWHLRVQGPKGRVSTTFIVR